MLKPDDADHQGKEHHTMTSGRDVQVPGAGNYVSVNGLDMYYEDHGAGQPLVLLHGAFSTRQCRTPSEPRCLRILFELAGLPSARLRLCAAEFVSWSAGYCCRVAAKALSSVPTYIEFFAHFAGIS